MKKIQTLERITEEKRCIQKRSSFTSPRKEHYSSNQSYVWQIPVRDANIILAGEEDTGKTTLRDRFLTGKFITDRIETRGTDFGVK